MVRILSLLITITVQVAVAQPVKWLKTYGQPDESGSGRALWQAADGRLFVIGARQLSTGEYDAVLTKTQMNGNLMWQKTLGIAGYDFANAFTPTHDENLAVIGITQKGFSGISDNFFALLDTSGAILDTVFWGDSTKNETLSHIALLPDSGYICAGIRSQPDLMSNDAYLVRLDKTGHVVWERNYGGPDNEVGHMVVPVADGYVFSADEYRGTTIVGGFPYTDYDVTVTKVDFEGKVVWKTNVGDANVNGNMALHSVHSGDGFILSGESTTPAGFAFDIFLARIGPDGALRWIRYVGGEGTDTGFAVEETHQGTFLVAGYSNSYDKTQPIQMQVTRLDSNGIAIDMQRFTHPGVGLSYDIKKVVNGRYVVAGTANNMIALAEIADVPFSDTFHTVTTFLAGINGPASAPLPMQVSPNPASGLCQLHLPEGFLPEIVAIRDISGKQLVISYLQDAHIDLTGLAPGLYVLHARDREGRSAVCRMVVE